MVFSYASNFNYAAASLYNYPLIIVYGKVPFGFICIISLELPKLFVSYYWSATMWSLWWTFPARSKLLIARDGWLLMFQYSLISRDKSSFYVVAYSTKLCVLFYYPYPASVGTNISLLLLVPQHVKPIQSKSLIWFLFNFNSIIFIINKFNQYLMLWTNYLIVMI